jgi:hypothetical protein
MLDEFTESKEEAKGEEPMESEVPTPVYSTGDYISIDAPEPQTTPITLGTFLVAHKVDMRAEKNPGIANTRRLQLRIQLDGVGDHLWELIVIP